LPPHREIGHSEVDWSLEEVEGTFWIEYRALLRKYEGSFEESDGSCAEMWADSAQEVLRQQDASGTVILQPTSRFKKSIRNTACLFSPVPTVWFIPFLSKDTEHIEWDLYC